MTNTSTSLNQKIARQKSAAPAELPKARLCSAVVLSFLQGEASYQDAIKSLRADLGNNWSHVTAMQYMSGRQAKFAAECGLISEQPSMLQAHRIAEQICNQISVGELSFRELESVVKEFSTSQDFGKPT